MYRDCSPQLGQRVDLFANEWTTFAAINSAHNAKARIKKVISGASKANRGNCCTASADKRIFLCVLQTAAQTTPLD
jgi:hypothetical protein